MSSGGLCEIFPPFVSSEAFVPDMVVSSPVSNTLLMHRWLKSPDSHCLYPKVTICFAVHLILRILSLFHIQLIFMYLAPTFSCLCMRQLLLTGVTLLVSL